MSGSAREWCPCYLACELVTDGQTLRSTATRLAADAVTVLLESSALVKGATVELRLFPRGTRTPPLAATCRVEAINPGVAVRGLQEILDPPLPTAVLLLVDSPAELATLIERTHDAQGADRRVAVVDDEPATLWMMQTVLHSIGLEAICIYEPAAATNVIAEARPRLILLDLNMPELPGRDLCRLLKADPRTRELPVLFVSGEPRASIAAAVADGGADGFVEKGADLNELIAAIRRCVGA